MLSLIFDEDDLPPHHERNIPSHNVLANFLIGASVSLLASCLSSLGVNLQASALKAKREANLVLEDTDDEVSIDTSNLASEQRNTDKYGATSSFSHETSLPIPEGDESYFDGGMGLRGRKVEQPAAAEGRDRESSTTSTRSFVSWFSLESFRSGKSWRFGRHSKESWRDFFAKWQWHLGFSMYLICQLFGSVVALGFVSPVVLAPLGSASLIFNVIFSRVFLGTRITRYDWIGTFLVVIGCAIVSTFGSSAPEKKQTIDDLIRLFSRSAFIIYFTIQGLLVFLTFVLIKYMEYGMGALKFFLAIQRRSSMETMPLLTRRDSQMEVAKVKSDWLGALYGMLGGTVASQTLLLTKSGVELLIVTIFETDNQFRGAFSFGLLAVLCFTVFLQLYSLNRGMHYSLPTIIIPIFYTFYTVLSLFNTLVYLDQFSDYKGPDLVCIGIGVTGIIGGVFLLARGHGASAPAQNNRAEEVDIHGRSGLSIAEEELVGEGGIIVGLEGGEEARRRVGHSTPEA